MSMPLPLKCGASLSRTSAMKPHISLLVKTLLFGNSMSEQYQQLWCRESHLLQCQGRNDGPLEWIQRQDSSFILRETIAGVRPV